VRSDAPLSEPFRDAGVRYVLIEHTVGSPVTAYDARLPGATLVVDTDDLRVYDLGEPAPEQPLLGRGARITTYVMDCVAGILVLGVIFRRKTSHL
jgi:hypothetical protein